MKTVTFLPISMAVAVFTFTFPSPAAHAGEKPSAESKLAELGEKYSEASSVEHHTLAAPLMTAPLATDLSLTEGLALLGRASTLGHKGDLAFEQTLEKAVKLQAFTLKDEASLFWLFDQSMDLRSRWFRLRYAGLNPPHRIGVQFDHDELRADSTFDVYLEDSPAGSVFFKLPDGDPFSMIENIHLIFEPADLDGGNFDFVILGLDLLPEEEDPLANLPATDLERFDWYRRPLKAENLVEVNTPQTF